MTYSKVYFQIYHFLLKRILICNRYGRMYTSKLVKGLFELTKMTFPY